MCLDRTVSELVEKHVCSTIHSLLEELPPAVVRREVVPALATVDEESPSGTDLKGAITSAVLDPLCTNFLAEAGVDARAVWLNRPGIYANAR